MHLLGQLSNPPSRSTIRVLEATRGAGPARRAIQRPQPVRLGNGVIRRAAARVLADGQAMKLADIRGVIEDQLGHPVSYASVEWCVRMAVRARDPWVERVRPGWYRLSQSA
jgi:hypothetical protein